ncbi:MAG: hypothetical protein ACLSUW_00045 [Akkermansia sp.]
MVFDTVREGEASKRNLLQHELPLLHGCDVLALKDSPAGFARVGKPAFPILEYNMESCAFLSAGLEDVATSSCTILPEPVAGGALYGYHSGF